MLFPELAREVIRPAVSLPTKPALIMNVAGEETALFLRVAALPPPEVQIKVLPGYQLLQKTGQPRQGIHPDSNLAGATAAAGFPEAVSAAVPAVAPLPVHAEEGTNIFRKYVI